MNILNKALREEGMKLVGGVFPKDQRKVKDIRRFTDALSRLQSELDDYVNSREKALNDAYQENAKLRQENAEQREEIQDLKNKLMKQRFGASLKCSP
jgi:ABC-type transporter Mla subunit MlaD